MEINYAHDGLFWQGCFYEVIEDLEKVDNPNQEQLKQLLEMQDIVFCGFLSPCIYEKKVRKKKKVIIKMIFNLLPFIAFS